METLLTADPWIAAAIIRRGGIVAFPTETVYGLGANVFDERAVAKIFEAKERPADNPLIAHVGDRSQIEELCETINASARKLIDEFFPGPLTVVVRKSARVPLSATAGLDTIGIRMPRHELARNFLAACGTPVVAPSANISGRPSPTTWQAVFEDLDGRIDCILQGEATEIGLESTVVDCTGRVPVVLRSGAISIEEIRQIVPETTHFAGDVKDAAASPGMRHKHYSPRAKVVIVRDSSEAAEQGRSAFIGFEIRSAHFDKVEVCASAEEYAHRLFAFFRECDRDKIDVIYCQKVEETGIGRALMDRLRRAAEG
ncbi:MAG TPA: L-threonylcarbamoyladenylate synthase [Pyrinomonadaceae bacterium]|nr:L-threonylcarbamoyladenylate synthase [Pyrinomonadaceae bacterium]